MVVEQDWSVFYKEEKKSTKCPVQVWPRQCRDGDPEFIEARDGAEGYVRLTVDQAPTPKCFSGR